MSRIVVIGLVQGNQDDRFTLTFIMSQLLASGRKELGRMLMDAVCHDKLDIYDMQSHPEKGDAMDHLGPDVALVIALHLYGIDKMPHKGPTLQDKITEIEGPESGVKVYTRDNFHLLAQCMDLKIPLVAWGDQPWYKAQKITAIGAEYAPAPLRIYEPN